MGPSHDGLPTGTVTFLFTDIEGSTRQVQALGPAWAAVLDQHHALIREAADVCGGRVLGTEGDAFFIVFETAGSAVRCAVEAQRALLRATWPDSAGIRVRMGVHTGEGILGGDDYVGLDVHRAARIAAAAHGGQIIASDAARALAEPDLDGQVGFIDLGTHRLKDLARLEHLYQVAADGLERTFPPPRALGHRDNLPVPLTSFVGRRAEVAAVRAMLDAGMRLVTLTGPGGTGKTRLSLQVGTEVRARFADGVDFVDLSMVTEPDAVASVIARALGLVDRPGSTPLETVTDHLRERTALLILDNFEQVTDAAGLVAELLRAAPGLSVVATSRGPLHVSGEHEYAVPPLELLDPSDRPTAEQVARSTSGALFVERALAARSDFRLTDANAPAVAAICARLDGLPLAIELAAARVRLLTPEAILARLASSLDLLAGGGRDLPARQQTLRGAIAWSYELLPEPSRQLFARMSVFAGGAAIAEIEAVCGTDGDPGAGLLDELEHLVDQSLLRGVDAEGEARFTMLGTVRAYASERLREAAETDERRRRHAVAYAAFAERGAPELLGVDRRAWLDRFELEHDNIGSAVDWALGAGETGLALRLVAATWRYWQMRGHLLEGRDRIAAALARPDSAAHPAERARALGAGGGIAYWLGDIGETTRLYDEALATARTLDDRELLAQALTDASLTQSADAIIDAASLARAAARAFASLDEALAIYRSLGDERGEAAVLWTMGTGLTYTGDLERARTFLGRSAEMSRASGDLFHESWATYMLASIAFRMEELEPAASMLRDALRMFASVQDVTGVMLTLDELANVIRATGDPAGALRLAGAVDAYERRHGGEYMANLRQLSDRPEPVASIGDDRSLAAAWADGHDLDLDEAVALALS